MIHFKQNWRRYGIILSWVIFGAIVPLSAFVLSEGLYPMWQGGARFGAASLLIKAKILLLPLALWATVALLVANLRKKPSGSFTRIGLWLGLIVSLFSLVAGLLADAIGVLAFFPPYALIAISVTCLKSQSIACLPLEMGLFGIIKDFVGFLILGLLGLSPWYTPLLYGLTLRRERRQSENKEVLKPATIAGIITLPFVAAAIVWAEKLYGELPSQKPECYVATAATGAHPSLVKTMRLANGFDVSRQLIIFKALEFFWQKRSPRSHAAFRMIYDRIGPPMAHVIGKKTAYASVTYLFLVPFAYCAERILSANRIK